MNIEKLKSVIQQIELGNYVGAPDSALIKLLVEYLYDESQGKLLEYFTMIDDIRKEKLKEEILRNKCKEFNINTDKTFVRFNQAMIEAMNEYASQFGQFEHPKKEWKNKPIFPSDAKRVPKLKSPDDLIQFKMHEDYCPVKGVNLYVFTIDQINDLLVTQFGQFEQKDNLKSCENCKFRDDDDAWDCKKCDEDFSNWKPAPHQFEQKEKEDDKIDLSDPDYHLTCDKCGNSFWSKQAFPKPHICESCKSSITIKQPPQSVILPSDEDIDIFYPVKDQYTALTMQFIERNKARREGAKAVRDGKIPTKS